MPIHVTLADRDVCVQNYYRSRTRDCARNYILLKLAHGVCTRTHFITCMRDCARNHNIACRSRRMAYVCTYAYAYTSYHINFSFSHCSYVLFYCFLFFLAFIVYASIRTPQLSSILYTRQDCDIDRVRACAFAVCACSWWLVVKALCGELFRVLIA